MQRRRYLAAVTLLVAGCNSQEESTPEPTAESTPTVDDSTATPTATPTPTATATPEPTPTPTAAERRANDAIAEVQSTLDAVVRQYGGSDSDDILAMDAAGDFNSQLISRTLESAVEELETARELAVTRAQERTVERLTVAHRFLRLAFEVQNGVTNAYFNLTESRRFFAEEDFSDASDRIDRMAAERRIVVRPFERIREETTADAVAVLPRIDPATYEAKVAQFDAELSGFSRLESLLNRFASEINLLSQARTQRERKAEEATESARRAAEGLAGVAADLAAFASGRPAAGDSLVPISESFATLAEQKAAAAREIQNSGSSE